MSGAGGFTIIELLVVIVIIGILAGLTTPSLKGYLVKSRDQERTDDVTSLVRRLEQAYTEQSIGYPSYPSTNEYLTDISSFTRTAAGLNKEALKAPGASSSSVVVATSTSTTSPLSTAVTKDQYVYQPLDNSGNLCKNASSATSPGNNCTHFNFYYRTEADNVLHKIVSIHQQ